MKYILFAGELDILKPREKPLYKTRFFSDSIVAVVVLLLILVCFSSSFYCFSV